MKLKQKIFKSVYGPPEVDSSNTKESNDRSVIEDEDDVEQMKEPHQKEQKIQKKSTKKKHKRGTNHKKTKCGVPEQRLLAYGISKKKLKKSKLL